MDLTPEEKRIFLDATDRRRRNGLDAWVLRWGKEQAVETLLYVMSKVETRMQEKERNGEAKPQRFKRVSAPRL